MAKDYIQSMLGENERIVLSTRQHWFVLFSAILAEITVHPAVGCSRQRGGHLFSAGGHRFCASVPAADQYAARYPDLDQPRISGDQPPRDPDLGHLQ